MIPAAFTRQFINYYGQEAYEKWLVAFQQEAPVSIRLHPEKIFAENSDWSKIAWNPWGRYLSKRPVFTLDPLFHAGAYYVQEAASQFLWQALWQCAPDHKKIKILDLCGAPGGKSSLTASFLNHAGLLVTNEIIRSRAYILKANMEKSGYANVMVTQNDPADFAALPGFFDIILIDAPCSGEGMFRKDPKAMDEWSEEHVLFCAARQKRILADVIPALKQGGYVIYSTCTLNPHENMENVDWACRELTLQSIPLKDFKEYDLPEIRGEEGFGYQFSPHTHQGEGLFISILKKNTEAEGKPSRKLKSLEIPAKKIIFELEKAFTKVRDRVYFTDPNGDFHMVAADLKHDVEILMSNARLIHAGINLGTFKQDTWIPHHGLALALELSEYFNKVNLDMGQSLAFFQKSLDAVNSSAKGWLLATYQGHGLGWMKNLGNRINNYLPNEARIRMDISNHNVFEEEG